MANEVQQTEEQGVQQPPTDFDGYVKWREAGNGMPGEQTQEVVARESEESEEEEPEEKQQDEKPARSERRDRTAEGRINELTARLRQTEQELRELRDKPAPQAAETAKSEPPPPVGKPSFKAMLAAATDDESYEETHERYLDALHEWREKQAEERQGQAKAAEKSKADAETLIGKIKKAATEKPDFEEVVVHGKWMPKSIEKSVADFLQSADSLDAVYHLATNPEEVARIAELSPARQLVELGKIEDRLSRANGTTAEQEQRRPKPVSSAPPPPSRVGGGSAPPEVDPMKAQSYAEYEKARIRQKK